MADTVHCYDQLLDINFWNHANTNTAPQCSLTVLTVTSLCSMLSIIWTITQLTRELDGAELRVHADKHQLTLACLMRARAQNSWLQSLVPVGRVLTTQNITICDYVIQNNIVNLIVTFNAICVKLNYVKSWATSLHLRVEYSNYNNVQNLRQLFSMSYVYVMKKHLF